MRVIFLGPPGAGKGTQATKIAKEYNIPHISTGDIFRKNIKNETELGKKAKEYIDKGDLVPDSLVVSIVADRLKEDDAKDGYLLDGFPRTLDQAKALDEVLEDMKTKLDVVINIEVNPSVLIKRITGRRICKDCGETYHIDFNPSKKEGVCDKCGGKLYQREDDNAETVKNRIDVYNKQTAPLIDYYSKVNLIETIDG
ncbi:MAG: adenylate kinase, partial [Bacillota bacterium]